MYIYNHAHTLNSNERLIEIVKNNKKEVIYY